MMANSKPFGVPAWELMALMRMTMRVSKEREERRRGIEVRRCV